MLVAGAGCGVGAGLGVDLSDTQGSVQIADSRGLLAFVNDQGLVTREMLDDECALRADAASNIVVHRDGRDGLAGSDDDDLFNSLAELDAVKQVGPETLRSLYLCAAAHDYLFADRRGLLDFVNDPAGADVDTLDGRCALRSDSARNIVAHRDGPDGRPGTADDNPFDDLAELDGVEMVGLSSLGQLYLCADDLGYVLDWLPPGTDQAQVVGTLGEVEPGLREVILEDLALRAAQLADPTAGSPVVFAQAISYLSGGRQVGYEVRFVQQLVGDDTGARLWILFLLDADYLVKDTSTEITSGGVSP
ncbi:MAG: hypothetical protein DRI34_13190 [Deltaproteobacteria bacterium]|nr:MAG: hypothetical protein DRI34_13190 [Deltaproteobacteria bacterium]